MGKEEGVKSVSVIFTILANVLLVFTKKKGCFWLISDLCFLIS